MPWPARPQARAPRSAAERRKRRREAAVCRSFRGRRKLAHRPGDDVERALLRRHRLLVTLLHRLQLGLVIGIELLHLPSGQVLQGAPVLATLLDQMDDGVRHLELDQPLVMVGRVHERGFARPFGDRESDVLLDQDRVGVGRELAELLLEARLLLGEIGRR